MSLPRVLLAASLVLGGPAQQEGPRLPRYDLSREAAASVRLPAALTEVSGLATDSAGRLFAHQDESSAVFRLDPAEGRVLARFHVGDRALRGDFEGIAIAGSRFFLMTSDGLMLEFGEAADGGVAPAREYDTGLGERCEIEGLAWDRASDALLVPCKVPRERGLRGHLVVLAVPLSTMVPDPEPRVLIPLGDLEALGLGDRFRPAAIEIHPSSGTLFLVSAQDRALVELSPGGRPLAGRRLPAGHPQAEGLAFGGDMALLVADEREAGGGSLTGYPLDGERPSPAGPEDRW